MDAKELRIGNWIEYLGEQCQCDINTIYVVSLISKPRDSVMYKPIPLSEQWLLRAGFEKRGNILCEYVFRANDFEYWVSFVKQINEIHSIGIFQDKDAPMMNFVWRIKYVHSLQNLYYALTGTELTFDNQK